MRAAVVQNPGKPEALELREVPNPKPRSGWVLIRVMAFGLNRSEMFTRQGHSGSAVTFPRILGIECVGVVEEAPDSPLKPGQKVAALMGGIDRAQGLESMLTQILESVTREFSDDLGIQSGRLYRDETDEFVIVRSFGSKGKELMG